MHSRFLPMMTLAATLGISFTARSASPPPPAPLSPALIGEVDGILSYCIKIDPNDANIFESLRRSLIPDGDRGLKDHDAKIDQDSKKDHDVKSDPESIEKDPSYQANFSMMKSIFESMPADEALRLCRGAF
jgi:hypothetical protein